MTRGRAALIGGLILAAMLCAVAAARRPSAPPESGPLPIRIAINSDIRGTNPGVTRDGNTDAVLNHVVESLVALREDLSVAPMLAERIEPAADGRSYRFVLRAGLKFHNGAPVTSAEVKWSWQRMLDPKTGFRCRSWYDGSDKQGFGARIVGIETPDARTVVFRLDQPNPIFLDQMASQQCLTAILHPASLAADGTWREPVGTGPYRIADWKRGQYVELRRFADYSPRADRPDGFAGARRAEAEAVRFVIVPEISVAKAALEAGDIDILPHVPPYLMEQAGSLRGLVPSAAEQLSWDVLLIQTRDPLFSDVRMRLAIAHAIDVDQVAAITNFGKARANPDAIPRVSPYHTAVQDRWIGYDPAKARAYLKAAGYHGQPVRIQTNRKYPLLFDDAVAIQAMLIAVGIDARLEVFDWATQLSNYASGNFQLATFSYSGRAHPVLNYASFVGSKAQKANMQWDDPRASALLREVAATTDRAMRQRLLDQLHAQMREQVPIIGLYNESSVDLVRRDIRGYRNWSAGVPRLWGVSRVGR